MRVLILAAGCIVAVSAAGPAPSHAIELSSFEIFLGGAANLDTTLKVEQEGYPNLDLTASYDTRPFDTPLYWAIRFGFNRRDRGAWELQLVHHKIYLSNPPEEIQNFEITHGFNVLTVNRSFENLPITLRVGVGLVLAHPDTIVRGQHRSEEGGLFDTGYHLTGPALLAGVGKDLRISSRFFVAIEAQLTASSAEVPIADGDAQAPNVALHGLLGVGYRF
jgi:hypothetical protein